MSTYFLSQTARRKTKSGVESRNSERALIVSLIFLFFNDLVIFK